MCGLYSHWSNVFTARTRFTCQTRKFTVSQSNVEQVSRYIRRQKEHHTKVSFREEFVQFLKANGIEYDERYV